MSISISGRYPQNPNASAGWSCTRAAPMSVPPRRAPRSSP